MNVFGYGWHAVTCNVGPGPCGCSLPNEPHTLRVDVVVTRDGERTVREGVTPGELRDLLKELERFSNVAPMSFVKHPRT